MFTYFSDRDSGKWNLDPEQTRKRRELFYELLTYDSWQVCQDPVVLMEEPTSVMKN
jgi:hypothetical protein